MFVKQAECADYHPIVIASKIANDILSNNATIKSSVRQTASPSRVYIQVGDFVGSVFNSDLFSNNCESASFIIFLRIYLQEQNSKTNWNAS